MPEADQQKLLASVKLGAAMVATSFTRRRSVWTGRTMLASMGFRSASTTRCARSTPTGPREVVQASAGNPETVSWEVAGRFVGRMERRSGGRIVGSPGEG